MAQGMRNGSLVAVGARNGRARATVVAPACLDGRYSRGPA